MNMMYKVISFDIGGTLIDTESNDKYNMSKLVDLVSLDREKVRYAYKNVFQKRKGTLLELVNLFCNILDIEINDNIVNFFKEKFSSDNNKIIINPMTLNVIKQIKNMGYKIILLSNSCCLFDTNLGDDIIKNVDEIFYSYDLGYTKNDDEIYKLVENKIGCMANEILHIGDTLSSDYRIPIKNGWNAIYYGKMVEDDVISISSLDEILDILRGNMIWRKRI